MIDAGKTIILLGAALVLVGTFILLAGKLGFRGLPGDLSYRGEHVRFYFPVVSCIVISFLLTFAAWLVRWLSGK